MKISIAQLNPKLGDFAGNQKKIRTAISRALDENANILILPFGAVTGFPLGNLTLSEDFRNATKASLEAIAHETEGNNLSIFSGGEEVFSNGQVHYGQFSSEHPGQRHIPFPAMFQKENIEVFVNLGPKIFEKNVPEAHEIELRILAGEKKAWVFDINLAGATDELIFSGLSTVIRPDGEIAARLKFAEEDFITLDINNPETYRVEPIPAGEEILYKALVTGIRNYFEKNNFSNILISVSGGIDSALVAALAVAAVGKEKISAVYLPSRFSSDISTNEARNLCSNLDIPLKEIPIESFYNTFLNELSFLHDGVWKENIQARIRGSIVMSIANDTNALVLATGNKTEAAMGYCTLYGDTCGGLAPISDLLKTEVRALSRYINRDHIIIPEEIITRPPSAELHEGQKDEHSLPNYEFLDQVLYLHCEENLDFHQISERLGRPEDVRKIFTLLYRSEYKRRQTAIGLKISKRYFGLDWHVPCTVGLWF